MQPSKITILGDFFDCQIYRGRLYLWTLSGDIYTYDWNGIIDSLETDPIDKIPLTFCFKDGNGLYLILAYKGKEDKEFFEELLESLSYTGIGGKRSAGFGRFEAVERKMPESLRKKLTDTGKMNILLSTALPQKQQLEKVLEEATYTLIRRGGFIDSQNLKDGPKRKKDIYVFAPGSCFKTTFSGQVEEEETGGEHSVFRYEKALFLGVNL